VQWKIGKENIMKVASYIFAAVVFLSLSVACATTTTEEWGADFDSTLCSKIIKGKSTREDVLALMGEPFNKILSASGNEKWLYLHRETTIKATPMPFSGYKQEGTTYEKRLEIVFDEVAVINYVPSEATRPWSKTAPKF
jgi:outer membrane protein assembly factor BamE (lipoprotein component of BamABCDE complex)